MVLGNILRAQNIGLQRYGDALDFLQRIIPLTPNHAFFYKEYIKLAIGTYTKLNTSEPFENIGNCISLLEKFGTKKDLLEINRLLKQKVADGDEGYLTLLSALPTTLLSLGAASYCFFRPIAPTVVAEARQPQLQITHQQKEWS